MEFKTDETLVHETCCECGIQFAMPAPKHRGCMSDRGRKFFCPNGHAMTYTRTNEDLLRDKVNYLEREGDRLRARLSEEMQLRLDTEKKLFALRNRNKKRRIAP